MSGSTNRSRIGFALTAALITMVGYAVVGLVIALVVVTLFPTRHGHNMDELLYVLLPLFAGPAGVVVGLTLGLTMKQRDMRRMLRIAAVIAAFATVVGVIGKLVWDAVERLA